MKKRFQIMNILILSFLMISINGTFTHGVVWSREWKVLEGDSQFYFVSKYFDESDSDGDGNKSTRTISVTDEDGESTNVILKKGPNMTVEIKELNDPPSDGGGYSGATIKITYNDKVTTEEQNDIYAVYCPGELGSTFVRQTVDNKSYWKDWVDGRSEHWSDGYSDYDVVDELLFFTKEYTNKSTLTTKINVMFHWKTGWLFYVYCKRANDTVTIMEYELARHSSEIDTFSSSVEFFPLILLLGIVALGICRKGSREVEN